jgi:molybdate transport system substrate-binding protein
MRRPFASAGRRRSRATSATIALAALAVSALALAGCATTPATTSPEATASSATPKLTGAINVFAAASLTEVFAQISDEFTKANPGVTVTFNFGGSSSLADQIVQGAPADVFAAASPATMTTVTDAQLASAPTNFATNTLEIAVPPGNPGGVTTLADFAKKSLSLALCDPVVPCGAASAKLLDAQGITAAPDTLEQDVKSVLTKVELGEVDAGIVYTTDVLAAGAKVDGVVIPEAAAQLSNYPIAVVKGSASADAAQAFVDFVLSDAGQALLKNAWFGAP